MDVNIHSKKDTKLLQLWCIAQKRIPGKTKTILKLWAELTTETWADDEVQQLYNCAHGMAGFAGNFGAPAVGKAARRLELALYPFTDCDKSPNTEEYEHINLLVESLCKATAAGDFTSPVIVPGSLRPKAYCRRLVYLVEDDALLAESLAVELREAEFEVKIFTDLHSFRTAYLDQNKPAAVIMDMVFPEGRDAGAQAIEELRQKFSSRVPVIYMSARTDIEARLAALYTGVTRYLTKPFDTGKLVRMLDDATLRTSIKPYRILLIDDDSMLLEYHAALLEKAGMLTRAITNPLQTLDVARDFDPEVIIIDMYMPGCSGLELAAILQGDETFTEVPLLFLSMETQLERQLPALSLGGDDFLTKPVDPETFVRTLKIRARHSRRLRDLHENLRTELTSAKEAVEKAKQT